MFCGASSLGGIARYSVHMTATFGIFLDSDKKPRNYLTFHGDDRPFKKGRFPKDPEMVKTLRVIIKSDKTKTMLVVKTKQKHHMNYIFPKLVVMFFVI